MSLTGQSFPSKFCKQEAQGAICKQCRVETANGRPTYVFLALPDCAAALDLLLASHEPLL